MTRVRPGMMAGIIVAVLVLVVASGLYAIESAQTYAQCSAVPSASCSLTSPPAQVLTAVFAAVAGLLAAIVMAITTGIDIRGQASPNSALARQLLAEDAAHKRSRERYEQLKQLEELARAQNQPSATVESETADGQSTVSEILAGSSPLPGDEGQWQEQKQPETADQRRQRMIVERLKVLARNKPDTVAEVIHGWIDQPGLPSR